MLSKILLAGLIALSAGATVTVDNPTELGSPDGVTVGSLQLTAGDSPMTAVAAGSPAIDVSATGASGVTPGMRVVIGDRSAPASDHAFAISNQADAPTVVAVQYDYTEKPSAPAGVFLAIVDDTGTELADTSHGQATVTLDAGTTAYVIVTIDSTGTSPGDDLSGTLTFNTHERS